MGCAEDREGLCIALKTTTADAKAICDERAGIADYVEMSRLTFRAYKMRVEGDDRAGLAVRYAYITQNSSNKRTMMR